MIYINTRLGSVNWNTKNYPSKEYVEGVGGFLESMANVFSKVSKVEGINTIISKLFGGGTKDTFTVFMIKAADSMQYLNEELGKVNWSEKYPSKDYAEGVGGFLEAMAHSFAAVSRVEGFGKIVSKLFGTTNQGSFDIFIRKSADSMKYLNEELGKVSWASKNNYPSKELAEGVGGLLEPLAKSFAAVSRVEGFSDIVGKLFGTSGGKTFEVFVENAAKSMIDLNTKLGGVTWTSNFPKKEFSESVGALLISMAESYSKVNNKGFLASIGSFLTGANKKTMAMFIEESVSSLVFASNKLSGGKYDTIIKPEWIQSFTYLISSISEISGKVKFDEDKVSRLSMFSNIAPYITDWSKYISAGNYSSYPSTEYVDNLSYYILSINKMASKWDTNITESENFGKSVKLILESFYNMPNLTDNTIKNMTIIKDALKELSDGIDNFSKRKMEEFSSFAAGINTIISSMQVLSAINPMPNGVAQSIIQFLEQLKVLPELPKLDTQVDGIGKLSSSFVTLSNSISKVNSNLENFSQLYRSLPKIKMEDVLVATDYTVPNIISAQKQERKNRKEEEEEKTSKNESKNILSESDKQKQFYTDISDIKVILYEIRENLNSPPRAGSFN